MLFSYGRSDWCVDQPCNRGDPGVYPSPGFIDGGCHLQYRRSGARGRILGAWFWVLEKIRAGCWVLGSRFLGFVGLPGSIESVESIGF